MGLPDGAIPLYINASLAVSASSSSTVGAAGPLGWEPEEPPVAPGIELGFTQLCGAIPGNRATPPFGWGGKV